MVKANIAESYLRWIRREVSDQVLDGGVTELTTPFLDRHNDHLQLYAESMGPDRFLLSDDGYILAELTSSGVSVKGARREDRLLEFLRGYGVTIRDNELQVEATAADLGQRVHSLVQAMLAVDDMFVLAQPRSGAVFVESVAKFLDEREIRYSPRVKFAGRSGLDHLVDFVIPKSRVAPERVLHVLNSPRRDRVESLLFAVNDTRPTRGHDVSYFALLNNTSTRVSADVMNAFTQYQVHALPWSERESIAEQLAA
jgi:uncharacterized protein DUF1828/uncharacterized protein DUF1829